MMLLFKLVPLLSRKACYNLAGWVGALVARLDRRGFRVAVSNLEAAFGDTYTSAQRVEIARESYQHFARTMFDLFWSPRLNAENFSRYVEFPQLEIAREHIQASPAYIVGAFHYSNFEWLSLAYGWYDMRSTITAQEFKNPLLDAFFHQLRTRSGHTIVSRAGAVMQLHRVLRKSGRVALLVDTTLQAHHPTVVIECFGLKTMITVAHAWLQRRTGVSIVPTYCEPLGDGRYRINIIAKIEPQEDATHREIAQMVWDAFEPVVRKNPAPWLWMYKHWRYNPMAAGERYPFYAQESPAFEQVAARDNYAPLDRAALPQVVPVATSR